MFDPAVIGTINIGMRDVAVKSTDPQRHGGNRRPRRPPRRAVTTRIAASLRVIADWLDPVLPQHDSGGTTSEPRFDLTRTPV